MSYVCHSGGANGYDFLWGEIGKNYGIKTNHYYINGFKTPHGNAPMDIINPKDVNSFLKDVSKRLGRTYPTRSEYINNLLKRNIFQVKFSDVVYAITESSKKENDNVIFSGGTAWAIEMARKSRSRKIYVYDHINDVLWFFDNHVNKWVEIDDIPIIESENFAGIGSRKSNKMGENFIREVYKNTFK